MARSDCPRRIPGRPQHRAGAIWNEPSSSATSVSKRVGNSTASADFEQGARQEIRVQGREFGQKKATLEHGNGAYYATRIQRCRADSLRRMMMRRS